MQSNLCMFERGYRVIWGLYRGYIWILFGFRVSTSWGSLTSALKRMIVCCGLYGGPLLSLIERAFILTWPNSTLDGSGLAPLWAHHAL